MKPLKYIIEGILDIDFDDLDKTAKAETISIQFSDSFQTSSHPGWGNDRTEYEFKNGILNIKYKDLKWVCTDNKFWDLVNTWEIKHIKCNAPMEFMDIDFDIEDIFIESEETIGINHCNAALKNCKLKSEGLRISWNDNITLDNTSIECTDIYFDYNKNFSYKNLSAKCESVTMYYDKSINPFKKSDWGQYIESLGVVKILPSDSLKALGELINIDEDFIPPFGDAKRYDIFTNKQKSQLIFMKAQLQEIEKRIYNRKAGRTGIKSKIRFKNDWRCICM